MFKLAPRGAGAALGDVPATAPYRTADAALWARERAVMLEARAIGCAALPRALATLYGQRWARILAGRVLGAGALGLVATGIVHLAIGITGHEVFPFTRILEGTLALSAATWLAARLVAPRALAGQVRSLFVPSEDARADVERLGASRPAREAADLVGSLERRALAWPLVGIALLLPLTLHFGVGLLFFQVKPDDFDWWIGLTLLLTGPAHATLAWASVVYARVLCEAGNARLVSTWREAFRAWGFTVLASLVPGVALFFIPPLLVAVTGLFIPIVFWVARRLAFDERRRIARERALV